MLCRFLVFLSAPAPRALFRLRPAHAEADRWLARAYPGQLGEKSEPTTAIDGDFVMINDRCTVSLPRAHADHFLSGCWWRLSDQDPLHWGQSACRSLTGLRPPAVDSTRRRSEHQSWKAVAFVQWNEIGLHLLLEFDTLEGEIAQLRSLRQTIGGPFAASTFCGGYRPGGDQPRCERLIHG